MEQDNLLNDILFSIVDLKYRYGRVFAKDIAGELEIQLHSVKYLLKTLLQIDYIEFDYNDRINLTKRGQETAENIYDCRKFLENIFHKAGIDKEVARRDAAGIEKVMSYETYQGLLRYCSEQQRRG